MIVEQLILGAVQGIAEWLPVSSEGLIVLVKTNLFPSDAALLDITYEALFLHLGTFFAALIYFWRDIMRLVKASVSYKTASSEIRALFKFLIISTIVTGALGFIILKAESYVPESSLYTYASWINIAIGVALLVTGGLLIAAKRSGNAGRDVSDLTTKDGLNMGVVQAFAAIPGLSRSGLTVSALLLYKIKDDAALRISFLMSLPVVFMGNIVLNFDRIVNMTMADAAGLATSFVFGLLTIHILLIVAKKINFGKFVIFFGILLIIAGFM